MYHFFFRLFYFLFSLFLLNSCQTAPYYSLSHLQSPEVKSDQVSISLGIGSSPARALFLVPDSVKGSLIANVKQPTSFYDKPIQSKPLRIWIPEWPLNWSFGEGITGDYLVPFSLSLNRFEFFFNNPVSGIKFQVLGDQANKAKKGNFSASLILGYGHQRVLGDQIELGTPNSTLNGIMFSRGLSAGLVTGLRIADSGGIALDFIAAQHNMKARGIVDGSGGEQSLTEVSTDYGAGIQIFASSGRSHFLIEQMWTQIKEPVRGIQYIIPSLHVTLTGHIW